MEVKEMATNIKETFIMRCPHCRNTFSLAEQQIENNIRFKCPHCHKYNEGSIESEPSGILIGRTKEEDLARFGY